MTNTTTTLIEVLTPDALREYIHLEDQILWSNFNPLTRELDPPTEEQLAEWAEVETYLLPTLPTTFIEVTQ